MAAIPATPLQAELKFSTAFSGGGSISRKTPKRLKSEVPMIWTHRYPRHRLVLVHPPCRNRSSSNAATHTDASPKWPAYRRCLAMPFPSLTHLGCALANESSLHNDSYKRPCGCRRRADPSMWLPRVGQRDYGFQTNCGTL